MAVTVKTIKKKPLTLKKNQGDAAAAGDAAVPGDAAVAGDAASGPAAVGGPAASAAPVKKASYTFAGICAILELIMFAVVLALQIIEYRFYDAPPKGAFPPFGKVLPIPGGVSSSVSSPVVDDVQTDMEAEEGLEDDSLPAE